MREQHHEPRPWPPKAAPPAGLPDVDALIAYRDGTLDAEAEARVRAVLEASPAAMAELLALEAFSAATVADGEGMAPAAVEAAWQRFETALDAPRAPRVVPLRRRPAARAGWLALAAALIAALGLSLLGPRGGEAPGEVAEHGAEKGAQTLFIEGFESGSIELLVESPGQLQKGASGEPLLEAGFEDGEIGGWTVVDGSSRS